MGARCQVCASVDVVAIHQALLDGTPRRRVAREYGLDHNAVDRHWAKHMPAQMRAASARAQDMGGPTRVDALNGDVLLGLAAEQYERSIALLDRLENDYALSGKNGGKVDVRSVVAALREVRQSTETLAKLSFAVQDRPQVADETHAPAIDAAITAALLSRGVEVQADEPEQPAYPRILELGPGTDEG